MGHDALIRRYNVCLPDCHLCEQACASRDETQPGSVIRHVYIPEANFHGLVTCVQCSEPQCIAICPTGAIVKDQMDGVVRIIQEKCVGCGMCTLACPYGGVIYNSGNKKAIKCDMCNGEPVCVTVCPYQALELFQSERIQAYLADEEFLSFGTRACPGCAGELAYRLTLRALGRYKDVLVFGCPGCMTTLMTGSGTMAGSRMNYVSCLFTNVFSSMTGVYRYYRHIGREVKLVAFVGDGCISDVSFQTLSGAAERGEKIVVICYDNEGYQNTGNQRSGTTSFGARTYTTPVGEMSRGKAQNSKYVPLIMVSHNIPYVATATIASLEDYLRKLNKALTVDNGMSYIHLFTPCPTGWGGSLDSAVELSRSAVETNYFPLWEYENGKLNLTYEPSAPKPISEFTKLANRFSHLNDEELHQLQQLVNARFHQIKALSALSEVTK